MQPYNMRILSDLPLLGYQYLNYLRFLGLNFSVFLTWEKALGRFIWKLAFALKLRWF
jgi:hypothetical protein